MVSLPNVAFPLGPTDVSTYIYCKYVGGLYYATMKIRILAIVLLIVFLPLVYFFYIASSLLAVIFDNGLAGSITFAEIEARRNQTLTSPIPNIIHQTWKNEDIPERWQIPQHAWFFNIFEFSNPLTLFIKSRLASRLCVHGNIYPQTSL